MTRTVVGSIEGEYRRYRALAEAAMAQLDDDELARPGPGGTNAVLVSARHVGGNLASRFTDFLTSDGEKPWREREREFATPPSVEGRAEGLAVWDRGWGSLVGALAELADADLERVVRIRGVELTVAAALSRSLAHTAYHVGEIVQAARALRGPRWEFLSIPPGGSDAYAASPDRERPDAHAGRLGEEGR